MDIGAEGNLLEVAGSAEQAFDLTDGFDILGEDLHGRAGIGRMFAAQLKRNRVDGAAGEIVTTRPSGGGHRMKNVDVQTWPIVAVICAGRKIAIMTKMKAGGRKSHHDLAIHLTLDSAALANPVCDMGVGDPAQAPNPAICFFVTLPRSAHVTTADSIGVQNTQVRQVQKLVVQQLERPSTCQ